MNSNEILNSLDNLASSELDKIAAACVKIKNSRARVKYPIKEATEIWAEYYQHKTGIKYSFQAKDFGALKTLLKRLKSYLCVDTNDEELITFYAGFLNSIQDDFVLRNLSLSLINSQFNRLMATAAKHTTEKQETNDLFNRYNDD